MVSLDQPIKGNEERDLYPYLPKDELGPDAAVINSFDTTEMEQVLDDILSAREARVIKLRYGFIDGQNLTLMEISRRFDLSREWIRQIEAKALTKLEYYLIHNRKYPDDVRQVKTKPSRTVRFKREKIQAYFEQYPGRYRLKDLSKMTGVSSGSIQSMIRSGYISVERQGVKTWCVGWNNR